MAKKVLFEQKLTNFYRYPGICSYQDRIEDREEFLSYLKKRPKERKRQTVIYIHVPFCRSMCIYCPFYKLFYKRLSHERMQEFIDSMVMEIERYAREPFFQDVTVSNINMGGGTPMVLETRHLERLLSAVYDNFKMDDEPVISIEGDPITLQDEDKLRSLIEIGLTRTSFGIQSFNEGLRRKLGVESYVIDIYRAVRTIEKVNLTEWGCDLLYNCPDQNVNEIRFNVDRICELHPTVVDVYDLNISPNTGLQKLLDKGYFRTKPSNKNEIEMFKAMMETFEENEYSHVRSVNFEPKGYKHSTKGLLYAFSADLLAIGPSARTFLYTGARNYRNHCSIDRYIESIQRGEYPLEAGNRVTEAIEEERDMVLFPYYLKVKKDSINYCRFKDRIDDMVESGYVKDHNNSIELTESGKLWAGNVQYYFHSEYEKNRIARSMFACLQNGTNLFNQDSMNC